MKYLALITLGFMAMSAAAEDVYVNRSSVSVRAGKGAAYDEVVALKKGEKMTVIARDGKWLKVSANAKEGWVYDTAVSAQKPGGDFFGVFGSSSAGSASAAEAGRGVGESKDFAKSKGLSLAGFDRMMALRKQVDPVEQERFEKEGKVGSGKP